MKKLNYAIRRLDLLIKNIKQSEPKKEDYDDLGEYMLARTIYRRFPQGVNEPILSQYFRSDELNELWGWANGENGTGFLLKGLTFLSSNESEEVVNKDLKLAPISWYQTKIPIFSVDVGGDIYFCDQDKQIYYINFDQRWNYLISTSLTNFINFICEVVEDGNNRCVKPEFKINEFNKQYLNLARKAGVSECYPFSVNEKTKFSVD